MLPRASLRLPDFQDCFTAPIPYVATDTTRQWPCLRLLSKNTWSSQILQFGARFPDDEVMLIQLEGLVDYIVIWKYLEGMNHRFSMLQWFVQVDQNSEASFAAVHQEEPSWSRVAVHGIGFLSHLRLNSLSFIPFYLDISFESSMYFVSL